MRRPDEDLDVIVHQDRLLDPNGATRDIWTIWLGGEKQGERETLEAATELPATSPRYTAGRHGCSTRPGIR